MTICHSTHMQRMDSGITDPLHQSCWWASQQGGHACGTQERTDLQNICRQSFSYLTAQTADSHTMP